MKVFILILFVFVMVIPGTSVPVEGRHELDVRIVHVDAQGIITAELVNKSDHSVRVWRESNTWGYARWRVLLIRREHVRLFYENPDRGFTRNVPTFDEISVGSQLTKSFNLNDGTKWISPEVSGVSISSGDTVVLIYDVPKQFGWTDSTATAATKNMHVWSGVVVGSKTVH